jgi:endonuclease-3
MSRLSAQCTDARVNIVAIPLFEAFPDVYAMSKADVSDIEKIVYPCGLYKTKARDLSKMCNQLIEDFGGEVPDNMKDLLSLAGVGRKIANLILGDVFGKGGIVADTHCIRISNRIGLVDGKSQSKVERTLERLVPKNEQSDFCHRIVLFGRDVCTARNPDCENCVLKHKKICKQIF